MSDKIDKIEKLEKLVKDVERLDQYEPSPRVEPTNREHFERLMAEGTANQRQQVAVAERQEAVQKVSPMEAAVPTNRPHNHRVPTTQELIAETNKAVQGMESVKRKLATPGLELQNAEVHNLKNKLSHIQDSIKIALGKVGLDYTPPETPKGLISPLQKFIGHLTHGQAQLESLSTDVTNLANEKTTLHPSQMLALQVKIGFINQELEFFASALNKSLESFKTIMNVQV